MRRLRLVSFARRLLRLASFAGLALLCGGASSSSCDYSTESHRICDGCDLHSPLLFERGAIVRCRGMSAGFSSLALHDPNHLYAFTDRGKYVVLPLNDLWSHQTLAVRRTGHNDIDEDIDTESVTFGPGGDAPAIASFERSIGVFAWEQPAEIWRAPSYKLKQLSKHAREDCDAYHFQYAEIAVYI